MDDHQIHVFKVLSHPNAVKDVKIGATCHADIVSLVYNSSHDTSHTSRMQIILTFEATVYQVIQSRWNKSTLEQTEDKKESYPKEKKPKAMNLKVWIDVRSCF